jgi:hypothetical protein
MFFKKAVEVAKVQTSPTIAEPEKLVEMESESPKFDQYEEAPVEEEQVKDTEDSIDSEDEVAALERQVEEAKARKKAKEEAEKAQETMPESPQTSLQEILMALDSRLSKVEATLFRIV